MVPDVGGMSGRVVGNAMIRWKTYDGEPLHLTEKEISRADAGWTIVVRPQPDGTWMVAAVHVDTRLPFMRRVPFVDARDEISRAVQQELRYLDKMGGMGGDMSSSSRMRQR